MERQSQQLSLMRRGQAHFSIIASLVPARFVQRLFVQGFPVQVPKVLQLQILPNTKISGPKFELIVRVEECYHQ